MKVRIFLNNKLPDSLLNFINIIKKYSKLSHDKSHELLLPLYLGKSDIIFDISYKDFDNLKTELNSININIESINSTEINDNYFNILLNDVGFEKTNDLKETCKIMAHYILEMKEIYPNINWQTIKEIIEKYK